MPSCKVKLDWINLFQPYMNKLILDIESSSEISTENSLFKFFVAR